VQFAQLSRLLPSASAARGTATRLSIAANNADRERFSGFVQAPRPCYLLNVMDELLTSIAAKKERLDVSREALLALQKAYDVDLTYETAT
jgi:hypothetical protein